jgi:hypothetical protein
LAVANEPVASVRATRVAAAAVVIIVLAAAVATMGTKWLWGYWLVPPALDPRVAEAADVIAVSDLALTYVPDWYLTVHPPFGASEHEFLAGEISEHISDRGVAPPQTRGLLARRPPPRVERQRVAQYAAAIDPGIIGDRLGSRYFRRLHGEVMEFRGGDGREYAFISVVSEPLRPAPHRAYLCCEFLLSRPPTDGPPPQLLSARRLHFGEGRLASYGWGRIFCTTLGVLALLIAISVAVAQLRVWVRMRRHRRVRGFAVESVAGDASDAGGGGAGKHVR